MKVTVNRKSHFNAAHRLYNADWTDARNATVFGKCANPNYHGHNYELIVSVKGEVHPETGFVMDMKVLKHLIELEIEEKFDQQYVSKKLKNYRSNGPKKTTIQLIEAIRTEAVAGMILLDIGGGLGDIGHYKNEILGGFPDFAHRFSVRVSAGLWPHLFLLLGPVCSGAQGLGRALSKFRPGALC